MMNNNSNKSTRVLGSITYPVAYSRSHGTESNDIIWISVFREFSGSLLGLYVTNLYFRSVDYISENIGISQTAKVSIEL